MNTTTQQTQPTEKQRRLSNFRATSDIETFYRFVHDNGLRRETKVILDKISLLLGDKTKKKRRRGRAAKTLH